MFLAPDHCTWQEKEAGEAAAVQTTDECRTLCTCCHHTAHPAPSEMFLNTFPSNNNNNACGHLPAHEVLEDGRLARTLSSNHGDLRQIQIAAPAEDTERLMESVHQRDELLHTLVPHDYPLTRSLL